METLKKHAFTIILVVVTLGIVVGAASQTISYLKKNQQKIGAAESLQKQLKSLRNTGQNQKSVTDAQTFSAKLEKEANDAVAAGAQLNRQGRKSLTIKVPALNNQPLDLFPVDRQRYAQGSVPQQFYDAYVPALFELLGRLKGASPPNPADVSAWASRINSLLGNQDPNAAPSGVPELLPLGLSDATATRGGYPTPYRPAMGGGEGGEGRGMIGEGRAMMGEGRAMMMGEGRMMTRPIAPAGSMTAPGQNMAAGTGPTEEARKYLQLELIRKPEHALYADQFSFYFYKPPTNPPTIVDMWKSMVAYWVHEYVVNVIQEINSDALKNRSQAANANLPLNIVNASIKRLVKVNLGAPPNYDINSLYVGEAGSSTAAPGAMHGGGEMGGGMMGGGMGMGGAGGAAGNVNTLTGHQCNTHYDVVRFGMTLVVRTEDLPFVLEALENKPGYTVLRADMADASAGFSPTAGVPRLGGEGGFRPTGGMDTQPANEADFFYGVDSVVLVQLDMEARLDCDWERPLMPKEMLARLPDAALRQDDRTTMSAPDTPLPTAAAPAMAAPGAPGASPAGFGPSPAGFGAAPTGFGAAPATPATSPAAPPLTAPATPGTTPATPTPAPARMTG